MQSSTKFALFWLSFFTIMQFYQAKERTLRKGRLVQNNSLKGKNSLVGVDFFPVHLSYTGNWSYRGFFFIWSSIEVVYEGGLSPSKVGFTSRAKRGEGCKSPPTSVWEGPKKIHGNFTFWCRMATFLPITHQTWILRRGNARISIEDLRPRKSEKSPKNSGKNFTSQEFF